MTQTLSALGRTMLRCAGAAAAISAETCVCARWIPLNPTTIGFMYLITVLLIATSLGLV